MSMATGRTRNMHVIDHNACNKDKKIKLIKLKKMATMKIDQIKASS